MNLNYDALTQLPNRFEFIRQLEAALTVAFEERSLLFIDLDRFQQINSALGYAAGADAYVLQVCSGRCSGRKVFLLGRQSSSVSHRKLKCHGAASRPL